MLFPSSIAFKFAVTFSRTLGWALAMGTGAVIYGQAARSVYMDARTLATPAVNVAWEIARRLPPLGLNLRRNFEP